MPIVYGCTEPTAFNYDLFANTDYTPSNCIPVVFGCLNVLSINFNPQANVSNNSCIPVIPGCIDNGLPFADFVNNGTGEFGSDDLDDDNQYDLDGDGQPAAKYNPNANQNDIVVFQLF